MFFICGDRITVILEDLISIIIVPLVNIVIGLITALRAPSLLLQRSAALLLEPPLLAQLLGDACRILWKLFIKNGKSWNSDLFQLSGTVTSGTRGLLSAGTLSEVTECCRGVV